MNKGSSDDNDGFNYIQRGLFYEKIRLEVNMTKSLHLLTSGWHFHGHALYYSQPYAICLKYFIIRIAKTIKKIRADMNNSENKKM